MPATPAPLTEETLVFDSTGALVGPRIEIPDILRPRACSLQTLDGSWLLTIKPQIMTVFSPQVRGPMRIEVGSNILRVSGDIYVQRRFTFPPPTEVERPPFIPIPAPDPLPAGPWASPAGAVGDGAPVTPTYPSFPKGQYSWYFRSTGVTYSSTTGQLSFSLVRHLWDKTSQEFISTDTGQMTLTCRRSIHTQFGIPATMTGTLSIGGNVMTVTATKTSDFYRGCRDRGRRDDQPHLPGLGHDRLGRRRGPAQRLRDRRLGHHLRRRRDQRPRGRLADQRRTEHPAVRSRRRTAR